MHIRIRMNRLAHFPALRSLAMTFLVGAAATACCMGVEDPDTQLQVELAEAATEAQEAEAGQARLCGAEVHAVDGEERIALEEVQLEDGCVYRAEGVDPDALYIIEASHPDHGNGESEGSSNPSCSARTDIDTTDTELQLGALENELDPQDIQGMDPADRLSEEEA